MEDKSGPHLDLRQNMGCILMLAWICGLGSILDGCESLPSLRGWGLLTLGIAWICVAVGIARAREWARCGAGIAAALYCLWTVAEVAGDAIKSRSFGDWLELWWALVPGLMAWTAFHSSTKKKFAEVREAIARSRAANAA